MQDHRSRFSVFSIFGKCIVQSLNVLVSCQTEARYSRWVVNINFGNGLQIYPKENLMIESTLYNNTEVKLQSQQNFLYKANTFETGDIKRSNSHHQFAFVACWSHKTE